MDKSAAIKIELDRLSETLSERFNAYHASINDHVPVAYTKKLWQFVLFTQSEIELLKEELEKNTTT